MDLILTIDYELYGDGSGNVFETMINPTNDYLKLCEKYNIKSTIFFEVIEYIRLAEEWEKGNKMGYHKNPAEAIRGQIIKAFQEGHDIQLHIHPQWINAKYETGGWVMDNRYWRLPEVPVEADLNFPLGLDALIKMGKNRIENILKPIDQAYQCNIFRAGGFNIFPSHQIIPILRANGFIADSSVFPGSFQDSEFSYFDYRNIPNDLPYWWINGSVTHPTSNQKDFLEIPVFAEKIVRIRKYDKNRIKIAMKNKKSNLQKIQSKVGMQRSNILQKMLFFFEKEALTWDYCLFSNRKMNRYLKSAKKIEADSQQKFHPFVLVGHSKEFLLPGTLEKFIRKNIQEIDFSTLSEAVTKINQLKN